MFRLGRSAAALLGAVVLCASTAVAQTGNFGVVISEVAFGPAISIVGHPPLPSYVELVNLQIANLGNPAPVDLAGMTVAARVANSAAIQVAFPATPPGPFVGPNVQPAPAPPPTVTPPNAAVVVLSAFPFPAGMLPPGVINLVSSTLFSGPNAQLFAAGVPCELCVTIPSINSSDRLVLGPAFLPPLCAAATPFVSTNTLNNTTGHVSRWIYVVSNTDIDFDDSFAISPGFVNPMMVHVNGFEFATASSPSAAGAPFSTVGATAGTFSIPANSIVRGVKFTKLDPLGGVIFDRLITNPAFDPMIGAAVSVAGQFTASPALAFNPAHYLPDLQIANELMLITANTSPVNPGVLHLPMGISSFVASRVVPGALSASHVALERVYSDFTTDSTSSSSGAESPVQKDCTPASDGGGDVWCEVIAYDYAGNQYRAKVKNWPGSGCPGGPKLALGTTGGGVGDGELIATCFNPNATIFNAFSVTSLANCMPPQFPFFGICYDFVTDSLLNPVVPFLTHPFHVPTDTNGIYLWTAPAGVLSGFTGITFYAVGIEYTPGPTVVQVSDVPTVTF